ncbi:MAG: amidase [Hydrotalea sp.]|nr:amidase [Hydrotalea sp.]
MKNDDILYLSARRLRQLFLRRELSPVEVMKLSLARADAAQQRCNCLTQIFDKHALASAKQAEANYANNTARPLEGIPLLVKAEAALKGSQQDYGSNLHRGEHDRTTDAHVARLLSAGAVPVAKTTTPEFSLIGFTYSDIHGVTTNPWHNYFSPGGSSGGSGAGLAMGIAPLATGSDIGGSLRIPAAWSGVVGFKPPYGRVPHPGPWGLDYYCHLGPMARSVGDIAMMMQAMAGIDFRDPASVNEKIDYSAIYDNPDKVSLRGVKIAMVVDWGKTFQVDKEIVDNMLAVAKTYQNLGASVSEIDIPLPADFSYLITARLAHSAGAYLGQLVRNKKPAALLTDYARQWGEFSNTTTGLDYFKAEEMTSALAHQLAEVFATYDAILTPTNSKVGAKADGNRWDFKKKKVVEGGVAREKWVSANQPFMTAMFNSQSRCPVVAMPSGFADIAADKKNSIAAGRMPTGVQLVGRPFHDVAVLKIAQAYEQTQGWFEGTARPVL